MVDKKIDIEIDGNQHYLDSKIIDSDVKRTSFLESEGWDVIRINWSKYQIMTLDEKASYIKHVINYINGLIEYKPSIEVIDRRKCDCGNMKYITSKKCKKCDAINRISSKRPPYDELLKLKTYKSNTEIGKLYGVTEAAIRKWIKNYKQVPKIK